VASSSLSLGIFFCVFASHFDSKFSERGFRIWRVGDRNTTATHEWVAMNGLIKRTSLSFLFFHWEASEEEVMFSEQYFPQNKGNPSHKR